MIYLSTKRSNVVFDTILSHLGKYVNIFFENFNQKSAFLKKLYKTEFNGKKYEYTKVSIKKEIKKCHHLLIISRALAKK